MYLFNDFLKNYLKNNTTAALRLIMRELQRVLPLFIRALPEELGEAVERLLVAREEGGHGQVDVLRVELHVDLLVDERLHRLAVVHAHPAARHFGAFFWQSVGGNEDDDAVGIADS